MSVVRSRALFACALSCALFAAAPARASVVFHLDLDELTTRSEVVAHATVVSRSSAWEDGRIVTRAVLRVSGALKGSVGKEIVVRSQGGVVGDIGQMVHGEAHYAPGEEVVAFLRRTDAGELRTVGMAQGKWKVVAERGGARAIQDLRGLALAERPGKAAVALSHRAGTRLPLAEFFSKVTARIAAEKSGAPAK